MKKTTINQVVPIENGNRKPIRDDFVNEDINRLKQPDEIEIRKPVRLNINNNETIFAGPFVRKENDGQSVPNELIYDESNYRPATGVNSKRVRNLSTDNPPDSPTENERVLKNNQSEKTFVVKEKPAKKAWHSEKSNENKCSKFIKILIAILFGIILIGGVALIGIGLFGKLVKKE